MDARAYPPLLNTTTDIKGRGIGREGIGGQEAGKGRVALDWEPGRGIVNYFIVGQAAHNSGRPIGLFISHPTRSARGHST